VVAELFGLNHSINADGHAGRVDVRATEGGLGRSDTSHAGAPFIRTTGASMYIDKVCFLQHQRALTLEGSETSDNASSGVLIRP